MHLIMIVMLAITVYFKSPQTGKHIYCQKCYRGGGGGVELGRIERREEHKTDEQNGTQMHPTYHP